VPEPSPILNNPYEEPLLHYATNPEGEIDYENVQQGRRAYRREIAPLPQRQGAQRELLTTDDFADDHTSHLINLIRREVKAWREGTPGKGAYNGLSEVTRVTGDLLRFWFLNPEREDYLRFFFAQREAVEAAIWLNEVAEKSNAGQHILARLRAAQQTVSSDADSQLPRLCFKMATGAGKTVVMAALILYHHLNRQEYGNNPRFADAFLLVAPGITIRDRLGVLRYDVRGGSEATDYYSQRWLVPHTYRQKMGGLNSRIFLTNYHAFEPKTLDGNKKGCFDGKLGADGKKTEAKEDAGDALRRLLKGLRPGSRIIVLNDEAHHCYLPKEKGTKTEEDGDTVEENRRAAVWFSGVREIHRRYKINAVYDLSATPYYLRGSGYDAYSLFPWIVTNFGLVEAIESGLVKIPFLPQADTSQELTVPVLRNLYEHVRDELPRAGQATQRKRAKEKGEAVTDAAPQIPMLVKTALAQFYDHYLSALKGRAGEQLTFEHTPPVFIIVCNNTSVSREVYKYIAGYEIPSEKDGEPATVHTGAFEMFSNYDATLQPHRRPPTLLIDSDALENSNQINDDFKKVFAPEVAAFKRDYARMHGQGSAENLADADILREVVNTVGKRNALGSHIRCVVSVSMLTEGWDANTVTHIMGLRAFGSQLLCEQVAGRALRRVGYKLRPHDPATRIPIAAGKKPPKSALWMFPPEYAHIIGVPFMPFKGGDDTVDPPDDIHVIKSLPDRADMELIFPNVLGYRIDYGDEELRADFSAVEPYLLDFTKVPAEATLATAFGPEKEKLTLAQILAKREQEIIYQITRHLIAHQFQDDDGNRQFQRFADIRAFVTHWYHHAIKVTGTTNPQHRKVILCAPPGDVCRHISRGINSHRNTEEHIRPVLNHYVRTGSTAFVHGTTTRDVFPTRHSHINYVVCDTDSWEQRAAKALDELADEEILRCYVKNAFLGFRIPYQKDTGATANYEPDFLIAATGGKSGGEIRVILEITGMNKEKAEKRWYVEQRWLPAVNAVAPHYDWPRWHFLELDSEDKLKDIKPLLAEFIAKL